MDEYIEKIEAYLNNALSEAEADAFEKEMNSDSALRQEVAAHRAVQEAIVDHELITVKGDIETFMDHQVHSSFPRNGKIALGVGGLAVAVLSTWSLISTESEFVQTEDTKLEIISAQSKNETTIPSDITNENKEDEIEKEQLIGGSSMASSLQQEEYSTHIPVTMESDHNGQAPVLLPRIQKKIPDLSTQKPVNNFTKIVPVKPFTFPGGDDCFANLAEADLQVTDQCKSGSIQIPDDLIQRVKNNKLSILLLPDSILIRENIKSGIKPGAYQLLLSDEGDCTLTKTFVIVGDECSKEQKAFSPERGERWVFELPDDMTGTVDIFNKSGVLIKRLNVVSTQETFWDGYTTTGIVAPMGAYFYRAVDQKGMEADRGTMYLIR
ncbi:hypothetical protein FNH22_15075 [Fulvivirga sp. M361]|uniref:hypothetical protein n=1 Tax=Fulvivirga sp. M361 TaxID=2594266 RepID=UPI001179BA82|nr:hypothetical protein [Fulvivirga sp. M361]TRX57730.1 hypothetical protein FNH22_15075 [Fulvivirga sp. M361]